MTTAFDPIDLAGTALKNRIVMAPMTRSRAHGPGATPTPDMATYYAQRADAGLIITEGAHPSAVGQAYPFTPGLHSAEQVTAWRPVTDAVHNAGGTIFAQLMHAGRIRHPSMLADGLALVGPSAIAVTGHTFAAEGAMDFAAPEELTEIGITETIADFVLAARNAVEAGFDGVELHGANGYLLHQFLSTNANQRTDGWGGSIEGRIRFPLAVTQAVVEAIGANRVGLRLSPANTLNDIVEDDYRDTYRALVDALEPLDLAYLHVMENGPGADRDLTLDLRKRFSGTFILNPVTPDAVTGLDELSLVEDGTADMISFGVLFLANPDLPARLAAGGPFNSPDHSTFYGGDERGYLDYPTLTA
ncbi:alkene reductase [Nocardia sp. R16R-3T]